MHLVNLDSQQPASYLYYYLLYSLPRLAGIILPIALMFGACFSISHLHLGSELVACYAAGRSFYRLILWILILSLLGGLVQFALTQGPLLYFNARANEYKAKFLKGTRNFSKKEIRTRNFRGKEGFYYIQYWDSKTNEIRDGFSYIQLNSRQEPLHFYEADNAHYRKATNDWLLQKVRVIDFVAASAGGDFDKKSKEIAIAKIQQYESLVIALPERPEFFAQLSYYPSELSSAALSREIDKKKRQGANVLEESIEYHTRFAIPINCVLLCFIGAVGGSRGSRRSGNSFVRALLFCSGSLVIYYMGHIISSNLAQVGVVSPIVVPWLGPLVYILVAFYFIRRS